MDLEQSYNFKTSLKMIKTFKFTTYANHSLRSKFLKYTMIKKEIYCIVQTFSESANKQQIKLEIRYIKNRRKW